MLFYMYKTDQCIFNRYNTVYMYLIYAYVHSTDTQVYVIYTPQILRLESSHTILHGVFSWYKLNWSVDLFKDYIGMCA